MQPITCLYTQFGRWLLVGTLVVYVSGIIWLLLPPMQLATLALTPYVLLLSLLTLLLNQYRCHEWNVKIVSYYLGCYLIVFCVEAIRVNNGSIFGVYYYNNVLGLQLWGMPLAVGCNWLILLVELRYLSTQYHLRGISRVVVTTLLIVAYGLLLEQVAPRLGLWQWAKGSASIASYLLCIAMSLLLLSWGERVLPNNNHSNRAAIPLLALQLLLLVSQLLRHLYVK